ncbi:heavy-metal-associated domain-containing protein [Alicyclobacillus sp. ALC3]|uniref:heavy-metal-associated domain-containing protein n=1 Tax=Alicyclobacillus sp. ALC3 TaxID=2796143 RepID=UPI002379F205|nr:cation transporter [Alicyclobacillus sp. ALC3]WDL98048.1 heavy-metal-associated domain-containing protein [Alicyclobacillus sp. ALC3]
MSTWQLKVKGMSCAHCKAAVESTLYSLPSVQSADADYETGNVVVEAAGALSLGMLRAAVEEAGYSLVAATELYA